MPVLAVNSLGVNAAMSFICGLSTIATLIEPVPEAGVPLAPELELLEPPPPQPAAITPTTANAVADQRRTVPLMVLSSCFNAEVGIPPQPIAPYSVGLCWLSSHLKAISQTHQSLLHSSTCV